MFISFLDKCLNYPLKLRIQCCCELWCRSQTWHGSRTAVLWCIPAATALIRPLAWELPYAVGVALESKTKKKKKKKKGKRKEKKKQAHRTEHTHTPLPLLSLALQKPLVPPSRSLRSTQPLPQGCPDSCHHRHTIDRSSCPSQRRINPEHPLASGSFH